MIETDNRIITENLSLMPMRGFWVLGPEKWKNKELHFIYFILLYNINKEHFCVIWIIISLTNTLYINNVVLMWGLLQYIYAISDDLKSNYQFTFNLTKDVDKHYSQINFLYAPLEVCVPMYIQYTCIFHYCVFIHVWCCGSVVEYSTCNPWVAGSNPTRCMSPFQAFVKSEQMC